MFRTARQRLAEFETQRDQIEIEINTMKELSGEELPQYSSGLHLPENNIPHLFEEHRQATEQKEKLLVAGLEPDHPEIIALGKKADKAMSHAHEDATNLKDVLAIKLELINRQVERMIDMTNERGSDRHDILLAHRQKNTSVPNKLTKARKKTSTS